MNIIIYSIFIFTTVFALGIILIDLKDMFKNNKQNKECSKLPSSIDIKKCSDCNHPFIYPRIRTYGMSNIFIKRKYVKHKFNCIKCNKEYTVRISIQ